MNLTFQATINGKSIGYPLQKLFPLTEDINGQWWNPSRGGEGFYLTFKDGRLIGALFCREGGKLSWYTFDCPLDAGVFTGAVIKTTAANLGVPRDLDSVVSETVGSIVITETGAPDPDPEPEPEPEPENPFEGKLTFRVKPFKHPSWLDGSFMQSPDGTWYLIWSTAQIHWTNLRTGRNSMLELEITAQERVDISSAGVSGYGLPSWKDVPDFIRAGEKITIACELHKASRPDGHANANFQLDTNLGTLVLFTARILGGQ